MPQHLRLAVLVAAVLALPLSGSAAAAAKPVAKAPAARDWSRVVAITPAGGFRMGNPAAPVKLVEYGSLACPHCRHFEETGFKPLVDNYVRSGRVSYEFRNLLIDGPDIAISLLTRCGGPAKFFPMAQYVYATQPQWQGRIEAMSADDRAALDKMNDRQRVVRFAELGGMAQIAAKFGVSPARAKQCVADPEQLKRLLAMTKTAMDGGIDHTPTFLINGKLIDGATWDDVEAGLKTALSGHG